MSLVISDERLVQKIIAIADQEQRTPEEVIADAVHLYAERRARKQEPTEKVPGVTFLLAVAGLGQSGETDVSHRVKEIVGAEIQRKYGFDVKKADEEA